MEKINSGINTVGSLWDKAKITAVSVPTTFQTTAGKLGQQALQTAESAQQLATERAGQLYGYTVEFGKKNAWYAGIFGIVLLVLIICCFCVICCASLSFMRMMLSKKEGFDGSTKKNEKQEQEQKQEQEEIRSTSFNPRCMFRAIGCPNCPYEYGSLTYSI